MSLDTRARAAVDELRRAAPSAGAMPGVASMEQRLVSRRRGRLAVVAVSCLVVVAAAAGFAGGRLQPASVQPADRPTASPSASCPGGAVECLGGRTYRVDLALPVTLTLPADFEDRFLDTSTNLEVYNARTATAAGVTIMESAVPVTADGRKAAVAGADARRIADWLAQRPFVERTEPSAVTVGGLPGYRVDVVHRTGTALPATEAKSTGPVALVFQSGEWTAAVSPELRYATYWLLTAPDGSLVVVWSWAVEGSGAELDGNEELLDGLRFG